MFRLASMALLALTSVQAVYEHTKIAQLAKMSDMVMDGIRENAQKDMADEIIEALDTDKDNEVSLAEVIALVEKVSKEFGYTLTKADK